MNDGIRFLCRGWAWFPISCLLIAALLLPSAAQAQLCTGALITYIEQGNSANQSPDICGTFCHTPLLSATEYTVTPPGCDPKVSTCGVTASTAMEFPGNHQNFSVPGFSWATVILTDGITYTYDDPAVPFSIGRLTSIERDGHVFNATYDLFGRQLKDGDLVYGYNKT